jgi:hypothetical protein
MSFRRRWKGRQQRLVWSPEDLSFGCSFARRLVIHEGAGGCLYGSTGVDRGVADPLKVPPLEAGASEQGNKQGDKEAMERRNKQRGRVKW